MVSHHPSVNLSFSIPAAWCRNPQPNCARHTRMLWSRCVRSKVNAPNRMSCGVVFQSCCGNGDRYIHSLFFLSCSPVGSSSSFFCVFFFVADGRCSFPRQCFAIDSFSPDKNQLHAPLDFTGNGRKYRGRGIHALGTFGHFYFLRLAAHRGSI